MNKTIYLIRHAKSSWSHPDLNDYDRPLNDRGKYGLSLISNYIKKENIRPEVILYSSAKRTTETFHGICKHMDLNKIHVLSKKELYHASQKTIVNHLNSLPDEYNTAFYIGHNPGITDALNYLTDAGIDNMPTLGFAEIEFDVSSWNEVHRALGSLKRFIYPKKLDPVNG
ncbi:MAG: SixA phosphatase family protein [Luteibaculum sp.]